MFQAQYSSLLIIGRYVDLKTEVPWVSGRYKLVTVNHEISSWLPSGSWNSVCIAAREEKDRQEAQSNGRYPQYTMQWQRVTPVRIRFRVEIETNQGLPSDITVQVKNMVQSVFNGEYNGIGKARIGSRINSGVYYAPIISISPDYLNISSLEISSDGVTFHPSVTVGIDQVPTIQLDDIEVVLV